MKKIPLWKNMIRVVTGVMLCALVLCACQPTPEKPVVVHKDSDETEQVIRQQMEETETEQPKESLDYDVPERAEDNFTAKDEQVNVHLDANIILPKVGGMPVAEVQAAPIGIDFVKNAVDVLLEGKQVYEPRTQLTKAEIMDVILEHKQALADPENSKSDGLTSGDPETIAEVTKMFEDRIAIYEALYEEAPETYDRKGAEIAFRNPKYYEEAGWYQESAAEFGDSEDEQAQDIMQEYEEAQQIKLNAQLDDGDFGIIEAYNYETAGYKYFYFNFSKGVEPSPVYVQEMHVQEQEVLAITEEEAIKLAQETLAKLGLDDLYVRDVYSQAKEHPLALEMMQRELSEAEYEELNNYVPSENETVAYSVQFGRTVNDVPVLYEGYLSEGGEYGPQYDLEMIDVTVNNGGITSIYWSCPLELVQVENTSVQLLPFEQILEAFQTRAAVEFNFENLTGTYIYDDYDDEIRASVEEEKARMENVDINIKKIELALMRVPVKDDPDNFRLVPAWRFSGYSQVNYKEGQEPEYYEPATEDFREEWYNQFAVINAIDGSVISGSTLA